MHVGSSPTGCANVKILLDKKEDMSYYNSVKIKETHPNKHVEFTFECSYFEPQINKVIEFIKEAHEGQFYGRDEKTRFPYYLHTISVASLLPDDEKDFITVTIALLHDVLEDTNITPSELENKLVEFGFLQEDAIIILDQLSLLNHNKDEMTYEEYIENLMHQDKLSFAHFVKIADNIENLSNRPSKKQVAKYQKSLQMLIGNLVYVT